MEQAMISCKNVAKLILSDQLQAQTWWKHMEVRLHLAMCEFCSRLVRQVEQLRSAAQSMSEQDPADPGFDDRLIRRLFGQ
jgi:hypothetical protein